MTGCASATKSAHPSPEQVLRLVQLADGEYQRGNLNAAESAYRRLLAADASYAPAHVRLGAIAYRRSDLNQAEAQFNAALSLDPTNANATFDLAAIRIAQGHALLDRYRALAPHAENLDRVTTLNVALEEFIKR
jgi:tetratricopeptide (TPR) repeat protein